VDSEQEMDLVSFFFVQKLFVNLSAKISLLLNSCHIFLLRFKADIIVVRPLGGVRYSTSQTRNATEIHFPPSHLLDSVPLNYELRRIYFSWKCLTASIFLVLRVFYDIFPLFSRYLKF